LGLIFFRERLRPIQWIAFGCAALGVSILTILSGAPPWISLGLALSFGFYGLLKKKIQVPSLEALGAETLAAAPIGALLLIFPLHGLSDISGLSLPAWAGLISCGVVTTVPLYCFAQGAKLLPLSALGFIQFISPTFQFLLGFFVFGESFPRYNFAAFGFIWLSVILYSTSLFLPGKQNR
jgi:chloramphenicol-sensitive protein RarD